MTPNYWTITAQDTTTNPVRWGTISATSRWYGARDDDASDWSAWVDNNPPIVRKQSMCSPSEHQWVDTGLAKTWCKKCDVNGRWVLGNVEITGFTEDNK